MRPVHSKYDNCSYHWMTSKRRFVDECYDGDRKAYLRERREDYCKAQFKWTCWLDGLLKSGEITQAQWNSAVF